VAIAAAVAAARSAAIATAQLMVDIAKEAVSLVQLRMLQALVRSIDVADGLLRVAVRLFQVLPRTEDTSFSGKPAWKKGGPYFRRGRTDLAV